MLLAEINGKPCPEVEGLEDLITSAVFGQLRLIAPPRFWPELFRRAKTVETPNRSLSDVLLSLNTDPSLYTQVEIRFWRSLFAYGEPDLLIHFTGDTVSPLIMLIEVKLNSGKSGFGERDQLARYLSLLDDRRCVPEWPCDVGRRFLLYLTRSFAADDLNESVKASTSVNAKGRMFGLEWNDILEVAHGQRRGDDLLGEVADFLKRRGFEKFAGFDVVPLSAIPSGSFYGTSYFKDIPYFEGAVGGDFYEK
jgi:hypothetical protein